MLIMHNANCEAHLIIYDLDCEKGNIKSPYRFTKR